MSELRFFVPGIPKTAGSKRAFINPKTGRPIITDDNRKGKDWRASVQHFAREGMQGRDPMTGALEVHFEFVMPRPKGHYGKGRHAGRLLDSAPRHPETRPDVLKMSRAVEDALTGIAWRDDAQIVEERLVKIYGEQPGVLVVIREMPVSRPGIEIGTGSVACTADQSMMLFQ